MGRIQERVVVPPFRILLLCSAALEAVGFRGDDFGKLAPASFATWHCDVFPNSSSGVPETGAPPGDTSPAPPKTRADDPNESLDHFLRAGLEAFAGV